MLKQLDPTPLVGNSFVTGVRPTLDGAAMHMIIVLENFTLIYSRVDFNAAFADGTTIYSAVAAKDSLWIGDGIYPINGVNVFDAYTIGSAS